MMDFVALDSLLRSGTGIWHDTFIENKWSAHFRNDYASTHVALSLTTKTSQRSRAKRSKGFITNIPILLEH
jgi:hypothetical protein